DAGRRRLARGVPRGRRRGVRPVVGVEGRPGVHRRRRTGTTSNIGTASSSSSGTATKRGAPMSRTAIFSVDGHVKSSRAGYRDYVEQQYLDDFDAWLKAAEDSGMPDAGNLNPAFGVDAQWDSDKRLDALESHGGVAEVLFPNGQPFQANRLEDFARTQSPELAAAGRRAYNRWLADFCAQVPGRRAGQAVMSFADVDEAVKDVHWAKEHGLGGIMMPPLNPGDTVFFHPLLDPRAAPIHGPGLPHTHPAAHPP